MSKRAGVNFHFGAFQLNGTERRPRRDGLACPTPAQSVRHAGGARRRLRTSASHSLGYSTGRVKRNSLDRAPSEFLTCSVVVCPRLIFFPALLPISAPAGF